MKVTLIWYSKCSTCQKAYKWLKENNIDVELRDIITENPTSDELRLWIPHSGLPVSKFFNTSGLRYKELGLKDVVKTASESELLNLLSSEGKLVKRPLLISDGRVLVGFKEDNYKTLL